MNNEVIKAAREALDSLDDCARMEGGVDAIGPRGVLEAFITLAERFTEANGSQETSSPAKAGTDWSDLLLAYHHGARSREGIVKEIEAALAASAEEARREAAEQALAHYEGKIAELMSARAAQRTAAGDRGQRLAQFRRWLAETGALPRGSSWIGELESIVAGDGEPVAEAAAQADDVGFDECVASGQSCSYGPHGVKGETQCRYCGTAHTAQPTPEEPNWMGKIPNRLTDLAKAQPTPPDEMTPEMMRAVQIKSELGAYAAANLSGAYDLFREFWSVALAAKQAAQPTQAGADPTAAATIEDGVFHDLLSYAVSGRISDVQRLVAHIDAAIAAARGEGIIRGAELASKARAADIADLRARLASAGAGEVVELLTDAEIEAVWEELGGMNRWLKDFGYLQFAHALLGKAGAPEDPRADAISIIGTCKRFHEDMHAMPIDWTIKESQPLHASVSEYLAARQDSAAADKGVGK